MLQLLNFKEPTPLPESHITIRALFVDRKLNSDWEAITHDLLTEHVGVLASLIIEDARARVKASPHDDPKRFVTEFILRVAHELPESINRAQIMIALRAALK
jgi:hypothetical protein